MNLRKHIVWSPDFSYAVGLITTDGNLSTDGRHLELTSKDLQQIKNLKKILKLKNKIGIKHRGTKPKKAYYRIQFGNIRLYKFLQQIGLCPNKTKLLNKINIPQKYFADFLRGYLDGDGFTTSYWDKRWKSSFMLYTGFVSASQKHLQWIQSKIHALYRIRGAVKYDGKSTYQLMYAKKNSVILLQKLYYADNVVCLRRKLLKIKRALGIIDGQAGMLKSEDRHA